MGVGAGEPRKTDTGHRLLFDNCCQGSQREEMSWVTGHKPRFRNKEYAFG